MFSLAQKFENQIFTAAMNVEDYNSRIHKKLSKVQKVLLPILYFFPIFFVEMVRILIMDKEKEKERKARGNI